MNGFTQSNKAVSTRYVSGKVADRTRVYAGHSHLSVDCAVALDSAFYLGIFPRCSGSQTPHHADEYDAAQERGEIRTRAANQYASSKPEEALGDGVLDCGECGARWQQPDGTHHDSQDGWQCPECGCRYGEKLSGSPLGVADLGLTHKDIHEARQIRDAGLVVSLNLKRRHLTESQRAMVASRLAKIPHGANQHTPIEAPSQSEAAVMLSVGRSAIQRARKVQEQGVPELIAAVDAGEASVSAAKLTAFKPAPFVAAVNC